MAQHYQRFVEQMDSVLHQEGKIGEIAGKVEKMTGVKRVIFGQGQYSLHNKRGLCLHSIVI